MTNGTITKQILKAAKFETGADLLQTAKSLMRRFPLSSEKILFESDKAKVAPEEWAILLQAAVETDKAKLDECNRMLKAAGCKPYKAFGRAKA